MPESDEKEDQKAANGCLSAAGYGPHLEQLADCLESDLHMVEDKYERATEELDRLRAHLLRVDRELTEEAERRDLLVERFKERTGQLQSKVHFWKEKYERHGSRAPLLGAFNAGGDERPDDGDGGDDSAGKRDMEEEYGDKVLERIEAATSELRAEKEACAKSQKLSEELQERLCEKEKTIGSLQSALESLEASLRKEIELGVAEWKGKLELSQAEAQSLRVQLEDAQTQLAAIPDLKRKIAELDIALERLNNTIAHGKADNSPLVDRELVSNLFVNLFDRGKPVDRRQVAEMLCALLRISHEDQQRMGITV